MARTRKMLLEEVDEDGSWAISYGDLVTLLMSFFVIYFSTDFKEHRKSLIDNSLIESIEELRNDEAIRENFDLANIISNAHIKKMDDNQFLLFFKGVSFFDAGSVDLLPAAKGVLQEVTKKVAPYLSEYKIIVYAYTDNTPVTRQRHRFQDNIELSALRSISVLRELFKHGLDKDRIEITGRGILPVNALDFMNIDPQDTNTIKSMQRTVAFVLRRSQGEK